MTQFVYYTAATLNGFLADQDHSLEWLFAVEGTDGPDMAGFMDTVGVFVEGSSTYEWVLKAENLLAEPRKWQQFYGARPTYVFTSRELPVPDGADVRFVSGDVAAVLVDITSSAGSRDVWVVGGGDLAGQFLDCGSLDRLVLTLAPAALISGAPLLPRNVGAGQLKLQSASQQGEFAVLTYAVQGRENNL